MEKNIYTPESIYSKEKIRSNIIESISRIIPFDKNEENDQNEIVEWLKNSESVTKKESPQKHLGVTSFITTPNMDKVFLINHKKACSYLMPGGHVDLGETLQDAIEKELLEELGLNVDMKKSQPFYIAKVFTEGTNSGHWDITAVFTNIVDPLTEFKVEEKEAEQSKWFSWAELESLPSFTQIPQIAKKLSLEKMILLDNGGVLADHYCQPYHKDLAEILEVDEVTLKKLLSEKSPHGAAYRKNLISREEFWSTVINFSGATSITDYSVLEQLWAESYQVNPQIVDIMKKYKNVGAKTGLLSNSDKYRKKHMEEKHDHKSFLDYSLSSCDVGIIKPEILIYKKVVEQVGLSASNIVYVDDRESHAGKAIESGMQGIVYSDITNLNLQLKKFYRDDR